MRFYWIRDRVRQGQFVVYWKRASSIAPIILPNTTPLPITKPSAPPTYMNPTATHATILTVYTTTTQNRTKTTYHGHPMFHSLPRNMELQYHSYLDELLTRGEGVMITWEPGYLSAPGGSQRHPYPLVTVITI